MPEQKTPYADILMLPHHQAANRPHMSKHDRAAQFSPFAALTGFDGVIAETGRRTDQKIELSESQMTLLNQKLTDGEWKEALSLMKKHQVIEYPGALRDLEDHTPIYIYSTINLYCSSAMINELLEAYREEADTDEARTVEENIYQNAD